MSSKDLKKANITSILYENSTFTFWIDFFKYFDALWFFRFIKN